MSMSKKDFVALADGIKNAGRNGHALDGVQLGMIADALERANPLFKRGRWLDYVAGKCGPNGGAVKVN